MLLNGVAPDKRELIQQEWETDYEKRVALLGFLVSPEGKRAFGALYELAKVHEEQVRLREEQEKVRQVGQPRCLLF